MTEDEIKNLIKSDTWMMQVLSAARELNLPDWMIGAGFVRNKVWDHLHGFKNHEVQTADIDLIYFDPDNKEELTEKDLDKKLAQIMDVKWSAKNQSRMHLKHKRTQPYINCVEALSEWVGTPTCVAVRLEADDSISLFAPHGIDDLVNLVVRPSPTFLDDLPTFWERIKSKKWLEKWPKLKVLEK